MGEFTSNNDNIGFRLHSKEFSFFNNDNTSKILRIDLIANRNCLI